MGPGQSQGMQGESLTGFEYFANQSQPQDPSIFSFYSPLDVPQSSTFAGSSSSLAAQAQAQSSYYPVPTSQPVGGYQGPPFHDPPSAGPSVYNPGIIHPQPPHRAKLFEPSQPQLRYSETYPVSVPGSTASNTLPTSSLHQHQEWYGLASSPTTTGEVPYYQDPQHALVEAGMTTSTYPQAQQRSV
jgi:hypothetical protein